jgi:hypothetical protein
MLIGPYGVSLGKGILLKLPKHPKEDRNILILSQQDIGGSDTNLELLVEFLFR